MHNNVQYFWCLLYMNFFIVACEHTAKRSPSPNCSADDDVSSGESGGEEDSLQQQQQQQENLEGTNSFTAISEGRRNLGYSWKIYIICLP